MTENLEIGVIPYISRNNTRRFVIITSVKHPKRWIFPKGQPEDDISDREVAINEAFEEAGIIGAIQGKPVRIQTEKNGIIRNFKFYPFRVSRICPKWPERKLRKRKFVKEGKASKDLLQSPYAEALEIMKKKGCK